MAKKSAGRPKGSQTAKRETSVCRPSRCRKCGSTNRTPYVGSPRVQQYAGVYDGQPYQRIVRRRTSCQDCGQARCDISYESDGEAAA